MYSTQILKEKFNGFLNSELKTISFYAENLEQLNYNDNSDAISKLLLDSCTHAKMICQVMMKLHDTPGKPISKKVKEEALKEEQALKELYTYMNMKTSHPEAKKVLKQLIDWEAEHEKLAQNLK